MNKLREIQRKVIDSCQADPNEQPLSQAVVDAFYAVPRYKFINKFRNENNDEWIAVTEKNLNDHLDVIYGDVPVIIHGSRADFASRLKPISTATDAPNVLRMIDALKLEKGQKVFELGAGSGWNAAVMGSIVGPAGKVVSVEIIPDLIENAQNAVKELGLKQVEILHGDAFDGYTKDAPYDRMIFTAAADDMPAICHKQMKDGGMVLLILKNKAQTQSAQLLMKKGDHFESVSSRNAGFVQVTGRSQMSAQALKPLLAKNGISAAAVGEQPFFWGTDNPHDYFRVTAALRSFLSIAEPSFQGIDLGNGMTSFCLIEPAKKSAVLALPEGIVTFGSGHSKEVLFSRINEWIRIGMPPLTKFKLRAYAAGTEVKSGPGEWIDKRPETVFVWSLHE